MQRNLLVGHAGLRTAASPPISPFARSRSAATPPLQSAHSQMQILSSLVEICIRLGMAGHAGLHAAASPPVSPFARARAATLRNTDYQGLLEEMVLSGYDDLEIADVMRALNL